MGIQSYDDINEMHLDVLREVVNIGSGNSASALSQMLGNPVNIAVPVIDICEYNVVYDRLGGADAIKVGTMLMLTGGLEGMIVFLLSGETACDLVNLLMFSDIKSHEEIDEIGFSAISEISNIMSASFVNAMSEMTGLVIDISPPESTLDMLGAIMSVPIIYFDNISDRIMFVHNELEIMGKKTEASVILLPDIPSLEKLMTSLGIE